MVKPKRLAWGNSPFDDMPHDELLFWARRMYWACTAARGALHLCRGPEPWSTFWKPKGTAGDAMAQVESVVDGIESQFESESIYRMFYRYAVDLLFTPALGFGWHICPTEGCGQMIGQDGESKHVPKCHTHKTTMRPIVWDDLKPAAK